MQKKCTEINLKKYFKSKHSHTKTYPPDVYSTDGKNLENNGYLVDMNTQLLNQCWNFYWMDQLLMPSHQPCTSRISFQQKRWNSLPAPVRNHCEICNRSTGVVLSFGIISKNCYYFYFHFIPFTSIRIWLKSSVGRNWNFDKWPQLLQFHLVGGLFTHFLKNS